MTIIGYVSLGLGLLLAACQSGTEQAKSREQASARLYRPLGKPKPGDWLDVHSEAGQTYEAYLNSNPVRPTSARNKIYLLPLGEFDAQEQWVLTATAEYLQLFFNLPVVVQPRQSLTHLPDSCQRQNDGRRQVNSRYILYQILATHLPDDALVYEALTTVDLYPNPQWNFVFGQASPKKRVGVSSMARFKSLDAQGHLDSVKLLERLIKTVSHETTHNLSLPHCREYECLMNGSNNLPEADRAPLYTCPACTRKIAWATQTTAADRYRKLLAFYQKHGLIPAADFCQQWLAINAKEQD
jgi:archaemetzincin